MPGLRKIGLDHFAALFVIDENDQHLMRIVSIDFIVIFFFSGRLFNERTNAITATQAGQPGLGDQMAAIDLDTRLLNLRSCASTAAAAIDFSICATVSFTPLADFSSDTSRRPARLAHFPDAAGNRSRVSLR